MLSRRYSSCLFGIAAVLALVSGCGPSVSQLRTRAGKDMNCPPEKLAVRKVSNRTFDVTGCGQQTTYVTACYQQGEGRSKYEACVWEREAKFASKAGGDEPPASAPTATRPGHIGVMNNRDLGAQADALPSLGLQILTDGVELVVWGQPAGSDQLTLRASTHASGAAPVACELVLVADGVVAPLAAPTPVTTEATHWSVR